MKIDARIVYKKLALIEGFTFTRHYEAPDGHPYKDHALVRTEMYCPTDGPYIGESQFIPNPYALMIKHGIERKFNRCSGWGYRSIIGNKKFMPINIHGEEMAIYLAVLAKYKKV